SLLRLERQRAFPDISAAEPFGAPNAEIELNPADIEHTAGHGFVARFSDARMRTCLRAGLLRSGTVEEDGRVLSRGEAFLADINGIGRGRYCVWTDGVYFSATDNTDPR